MTPPRRPTQPAPEHPKVAAWVLIVVVSLVIVLLAFSSL